MQHFDFKKKKKWKRNHKLYFYKIGIIRRKEEESLKKKIRIFRRVIIYEKTLKTLLIFITLRLASLCFKTYINLY